MTTDAKKKQKAPPRRTATAPQQPRQDVAAPATPTAATDALPASARGTSAPVTAPAATPAVKTDGPGKPDKPKKPKLVRDSFTIPKNEYAVLDALKARALKAGTPAKKSELLRAGIRVLAEMPEAAFLEALAAVPALKTGRPAKG